MSSSIPTPHIAVTNPSDIAPTVLMPGDPLRATFTAENFLSDPVLHSSIRGIPLYTGLYKGQRISVMASGMGMASMGIYSYELFRFFGIENIIRIGSCGAYTAELALGDILLVADAYSRSTYALEQHNCTDDILLPSTKLNHHILSTAQASGQSLRNLRVHCTDVFYSEHNDFAHLRDTKGCAAVDMESFSLFANARITDKHAAVLLTVTDNLVTGQKMPALQRQNGFATMIELALQAGISAHS